VAGLHEAGEMMQELRAAVAKAALHDAACVTDKVCQERDDTRSFCTEADTSPCVGLLHFLNGAFIFC
jgi:hypothetical protein